MSELIVVGLHGKHRAAEVLEELQQLDDEWVIDLEDAVAAYRRDNGKLRVEQSLTLTGKQAGSLGATLGILVGGLLAAPFTAGSSAAIAAATISVNSAVLGTAGAVASADFATKQKEKFGISDELVRQVAGMLQPGESAIFALMSTTTPGFVADHFARYGGRILRTTLKPDAAASVQQTIGA